MTIIQDGPVELEDIRAGDYGTKIAAIEPGGAGFIPLTERHGKPLQLFWTWMSPNFEFATVFVGVIAVLFFGLNFTQAVAAIVLGTVLGSITHGILSARGPKYGVPQMVLSRISFGYWGNILPAGINALIAGIGWFAVNSVSGALALSTLFGWNDVGCLLIIVAVQIGVALLGHNVVHLYERVVFPFLVVAFVLAAIFTFHKSHLGAPSDGGGFGGFTLALGATFGYAVGWNPYASDYTRYMSPDTDKRAVGMWAGLGVAISCVALEVVGAASATIGNMAKNPTAQFTNPLPNGIANVTLIAIAVGAIAANALNIYSGAISATTLGIPLPDRFRRAIIAGVFGVIGFFVAWGGLSDAGDKYNNFLLIIAYWVGPWLAVFLLDQILRPKDNLAELLFDRRHTSWAGPIAMATGMAVSILLFSNQTKFTGFITRHTTANGYGIGDLTFEVGFVLTAMIYLFGYYVEKHRNPRTITLPA